MAKTKVHSTTKVKQHKLVEFYFGNCDSEWAVAHKIPGKTKKSMKTAEKLLLSEYGLEENVAASQLIKTITRLEEGDHDANLVFCSVLASMPLDGIPSEIAINMIKTSYDVLRLMRVYTNHNFVVYNHADQTLYIRKTPVNSIDWEYVGLNKEVYRSTFV